jgi:histone H3/H4
MSTVLPKAAVRRHAIRAWSVIVGGDSFRIQKVGLEYLHRILQRQIQELVRACARMKQQGRSKTTRSENLLLVRELLFSQIPAAPPTVHIPLSLSKNSFRRICRREGLVMSKKVSEGCPSSLNIMRLLLGDLVYAIFLRCVTSNGTALVTEDDIVSAVRHLRLCDVYTF